MNRRGVVFMVLAGAVAGIAVLGACLSPFPRLPLTPMPAPPPTSALAWRLVQGVPCLPPCWEGLTPGVSTWDDAQQTMERLRQSEQVAYAECHQMGCTAKEQDGTTVIIYIGDKGRVGFIVGTAPDDTVGGGLGPDVQELFALLGEPTWVLPWGYGPSRSCACDPSHTLPSYLGYPEVLPSVDLLYLDRGASFNFSVTPEDFGCVCPYMKLNVFRYFSPVSSPTEYENIRTEDPLYELYIERIEESRLIPWQGFGPGYAR